MTKQMKLIISGVILVLLIAGGIFFFQNKGEVTEYKRFKVVRGDLAQKVESTGTVSPQNRLEIKPPVAGRIDQILVKEGDVVQKGKVLAWISSNERAALMDAVRMQGKDEIKKWENLYKATPIVAPISGTIILRNVETGQSFTNTDPIFVMADRLTVKAQIDETDIAFIKINQSAKIVLDAYPDTPIEGKVVHLAYDATLTNNVTTYQVDVLPLNPPEFLRSGMTSNVNVEVEKKENVLKIPSIAVQTTEEGPMVLTGTEKKPSMIPIQTGLDDGKFIEVTGGILEGEEVLVKQSASLKKKSAGGSPFMPTRPRGGGGGGRR
ncbi:MAG: HlyD family efflux transporter periplasmic adaptor subunit [Bdellovibrionota bacterium]